MADNWYPNSYPDQIKRVIMDTRLSGAKCEHLGTLLRNFQAADKKQFDRYVRDTGDGVSLPALAIVFAEADKCSCLDVIRKFDGGNLYNEVKGIKVPLETGGHASHTLEEFARDLEMGHCFSKDGGRGRKNKGRRFFKRHTKLKRVESRPMRTRRRSARRRSTSRRCTSRRSARRRSARRA